MVLVPTARVRDVFICYASQDATVALAICATLEANRIACWMAPRDIPPGEKYGEVIIQAIKTSRVLVFVFSSRSNASEHTVREIERAVYYKLTIIPFRIENVAPSKELEYFLCAPQWLDAVGRPFQQQLPSLVATVSQQLRKPRAADLTQEGPPLPPPPPPPPLPAPLAAPARPVQPQRADPRSLLPWLLAGGLAAILLLVGAVVAVRTLTSGHAPAMPKAPSVRQERLPAAPRASVPAPSSAPRASVPDPSSATVQELANRGIQLMRQGDFAAATEDFTAAIRLAPQSAQLYAFRAQSYQQQEDFRASVADWTRFIEIEPGSHQGYSARGQDYLRLNDCERALADFRMVVQRQPDSWLGYELLGDASRKKGDHQRTIEYYQEDLRRKPPDPAAVYFYMGEAAAQMGNAAQARAYRAQAESLDANVKQRLSAK